LGKTKNLLWNPAFDTIFCDGFTQDLGINFFYADTLAQQFPFEVAEVRYLALLSSHWVTGTSTKSSLSTKYRGSRKKPSSHFKALSEVCIVFDEPYESQYVRNIKPLQAKSSKMGDISPPWRVPGDIQVVFKAEKMKRPDWECVVPTVRLVGSQDKIITGPEEFAALRCYPCPDMFKLVGREVLEAT